MGDIMPDIIGRHFEQLKVAYQARVSRNFPPGIQIDALESYIDIHDELVAKVTARVLIERLEPFPIKRQKTVCISVPRTWWDHFKLTYKDKWWMRYRIIRYKTITREVEFTAIIKPMMAFPHSSQVPYTSPARLGEPVRIFELEDYQEERELKDDNS